MLMLNCGGHLFKLASSPTTAHNSSPSARRICHTLRKIRPIRHGFLEHARQQAEQEQSTKGCLRPLPRPKAAMHLGSQGAAMPALRKGEHRVHCALAAPHGPPTAAPSQCQQPHPRPERGPLRLVRGEPPRARLGRRSERHAHGLSQPALSPARLSSVVSTRESHCGPLAVSPVCADRSRRD